MSGKHSIEIHLRAIRDSLWSGRAAVMVGAGLNSNAKPLCPSTGEFPSWRIFAEPLLGKLEEAEGNKSIDFLRAQVASPAGIMRLMEEFEAVFGRSALDKSVANIIPDRDFDPGELHHMLVDLPWADIFTTNFDTLLERAADNIPQRKYNLVYIQEELARAVRPRIVKLHGSLPAITPFILTEDDYRTYRHRFSLFVNTVLQAVIENKFCFIGFSPQSPNLLHWTRLIRDNLASQTPKIYLCGLLDLTVGEERMLHQLGVIPVDLARLNDFRAESKSIRNTAALQWLLGYLKSQRGNAYDQHLNKEANILIVELMPVECPYPSLHLETILHELRILHNIALLATSEIEYDLAECSISDLLCNDKGIPQNFRLFIDSIERGSIFLTLKSGSQKALNYVASFLERGASAKLSQEIAEAAKVQNEAEIAKATRDANAQQIIAEKERLSAEDIQKIYEVFRKESISQLEFIDKLIEEASDPDLRKILTKKKDETILSLSEQQMVPIVRHMQDTYFRIENSLPRFPEL
jgi:hypothetical protein